MRVPADLGSAGTGYQDPSPDYRGASRTPQALICHSVLNSERVFRKSGKIACNATTTEITTLTESEFANNYRNYRRQRLNLWLEATRKASFDLEHRNSPGPFKVGRTHRLPRDRKNSRRLPKACSFFLSARRYRLPPGQWFLYDRRNGHRPVLDPFHVRNRNGNYIQSDRPRGGRNPKRAAQINPSRP